MKLTTESTVIFNLKYKQTDGYTMRARRSLSVVFFDICMVKLNKDGIF